MDMNIINYSTSAVYCSIYIDHVTSHTQLKIMMQYNYNSLNIIDNIVAKIVYIIMHNTYVCMYVRT